MVGMDNKYNQDHKHAPESECEDEKQRSLGAGRFARRAKSFKDDFLDKINQVHDKIRSPSLTRSTSPPIRRYRRFKTRKASCANDSGGSDASQNDSPKVQRSLVDENEKKSKEERDIDNAWNFVKQMSNALRYLKDVVEKNKLEQLPGASSILLEIVVGGYAGLRAYLIGNEQSSMLMSATNQVYNSLANLIKWSDTVLLHDYSTLDRDSVAIVVADVQEAVKGLVQLCVDRQRRSTDSGTSKSEDLSEEMGQRAEDRLSSNTSQDAQTNYRNSYPESPSTLPRKPNLHVARNQDYDRHALRHTHQTPGFSLEKVSHSLSSDSILNSTVDSACRYPPPKPPLKPHIQSDSGDKTSPEKRLGVSSETPPPLPPKKKNSVASSYQFRVSEASTDLSQYVSQSSSIDSYLNFIPEYSRSADDLLSIGTTDSDKKSLNLTPEFANTFHPQEARCCLSEQFSKSYHCSVVERCSSFSSPSSTSKVNSSLTANDVSEKLQYLSVDRNEISPPALPVKLRNKNLNNVSALWEATRPPSQYDNVTNLDFASNSSLRPNCTSHIPLPTWTITNHSPLCSDNAEYQGEKKSDNESNPPPLPPKKRNIMTYMEMMGSYGGPNDAALNLYRHSVHTYHLVNSHNHAHSWKQVELSFLQQKSTTRSFISTTTESGDSLISAESSSDSSQLTDSGFKNNSVPPALPPKKNKLGGTLRKVQNDLKEKTPIRSSTPVEKVPPKDLVVERKSEKVQPAGPLDLIDVSPYLIYKASGEDGPEIRGGHPDALLVKATEVSKNDFLFQEAFIATYRTMLSPTELIEKLLYRYNKFIHVSDMRQRAAKNSFALLVRVVDDLCLTDCTEAVLNSLLEFVYQLVTRGDLALARVLRAKIIEKADLKRNTASSTPILLPSMAITVKQNSCLDFKSELIAEQMTLLDAHLFEKIEVAEVLSWTREQKEEMIPNLNKFTEHFNKVSYWVRTRVLELEDGKDREKLVLKFIKVMKHLKKLNNFNSYLALLSALDSAPIRRLEWQRNITETMKEYSSLIDSSSSFRTYRQALAETQPPCIPYIGLILQDLTFVHIGNSDNFNDGNINFAKRWQIFNILDQMRRFRNSHYPFKRNEQVIAFFNDFDNYISEEAIWQISEAIKPRGSAFPNK